MADPWQAFELDGMLGERADGKWSAFEVVIIAPRQNGKNGIIEIRELAGLYLFGEELILHSSHEFKTSQEAFLRIRYLVENCDELRKRVDKIRTSHGDEGIELLATKTLIAGSTSKFTTISRTPRLRFVARTSGSGRGFSGDTIVFDEAMHLPTPVISALMPTVSARPNPQLIYTGSAVNQEEHQHGEVLTRLRNRGLAGDDPSLAFFEHCADEDAYHADPVGTATDPRQQRMANPGMAVGRITEEHVAREQRSMPAKTFMVERLGIGDWPTLADGISVVDAAVWAALVDRMSAIEGDVVFAVDATPGRTAGAIAVAGKRSDDLLHGEIVEHRPGTGWMLNRLIELHKSWGPRAVVLNPGSAAGSLSVGLREAGIELVEVSGRGEAQACGWIYDLITNSGVRHLGQPELAAALAAAQKRDMGDAWVWDRKDSNGDISPLGAFTLALNGFAQPTEPEQPFFASWT